MTVTFQVDDVSRAELPPATQPLSERYPDALVLGLPGDLRVVQPPDSRQVGMPTDARGVHPLLSAVHIAFAEHRPLVLSPDTLWITIAQGVAQHVRLHSEELRGRFVRHRGRKELRVRALSWATAADWQRIVGGFRAAMAEELGAGIARTLTCDFSTTTDVERTASEVVLMDAFSPYYEYTVMCVCGIPEITLRGTPADWRAIRARVDILAEFGLGFWTESLAPIADQWIRASEGAPDPEFWRAIYKPRHAYGWDRIAGWVARLFPYVAEGGRFTRRNPLLEHRIGREPQGKDMFSVSGIVASDAPSGISSVRCKLEDEKTGATERVVLEGGLLAVTSDEGGRLEAQCGWLLRQEPPTMRAMIERLRETPGVVLSPRGARAEEAARAPKRFLDEGLGAELEELFDEFDEVVLFEAERRWSLARPRSEDRITVRSKAWRWGGEAVRVIDLHDGTFLARIDANDEERRLVWVRMAANAVSTETISGLDEVTGLTRPPRQVQASREDGATLPVVGASLAAILERALDSRGNKDLPVQGGSPQQK